MQYSSHCTEIYLPRSIVCILIFRWRLLKQNWCGICFSALSFLKVIGNSSCFSSAFAWVVDVSHLRLFLSGGTTSAFLLEVGSSNLTAPFLIMNWPIFDVKGMLRYRMYEVKDFDGGVVFFLNVFPIFNNPKYSIIFSLAPSTELLSSFSVSSLSCLRVLVSRSLDKGWTTAEDEYPDEDSSAWLSAELTTEATEIFSLGLSKLVSIVPA